MIQEDLKQPGNLVAIYGSGKDLMRAMAKTATCYANGFDLAGNRQLKFQTQTILTITSDPAFDAAVQESFRESNIVDGAEVVCVEWQFWDIPDMVEVLKDVRYIVALDCRQGCPDYVVKALYGVLGKYNNLSMLLFLPDDVEHPKSLLREIDSMYAVYEENGKLLLESCKIDRPKFDNRIAHTRNFSPYQSVLRV